MSLTEGNNDVEPPRKHENSRAYRFFERQTHWTEGKLGFYWTPAVARSFAERSGGSVRNLADMIDTEMQVGTPLNNPRTHALSTLIPRCLFFLSRVTYGRSWCGHSIVRGTT